MKTKRFFFHLLFVLLFTPFAAQAVIVGDFKYTLDVNTQTASIDGFAPTAVAIGELVIPATIVDNSVVYNVTKIGHSAFRDKLGITTLKLPEGLLEIGIWAFIGCKNLTGELEIPSTVHTIHMSAFKLCSGLTGSLNIPNSITVIGPGAFSECSGFNGSLTISNSLTIIGAEVFSGCSSLTGELNIPSSVTIINSQAFKGCKNFTGSLTIPSSVQTINPFAFQGCSGFDGSLTIPNSVTSIGGEAFEGCSGFKGSLNIPSELTTISIATFANCSGFTGLLNIPSSVTNIGAYAFLNCSNISNVIVSNVSSTQIGDFVFTDCVKLQTLTFLGITPPLLSTTPAPLGIQSCTNIIVPNTLSTTYKDALGFSDYRNQIYEENDRLLQITSHAPRVNSGSSYNYTGFINRNSNSCITYSISGFPDDWQVVSNLDGGFTISGSAPTQSFTGTLTATEEISNAVAVETISYINYYMPQNVRSLNRFMTLSIPEAVISFVYEAGAQWRVYSSNGVLIGKDYVDNYSLMLIDGYGLVDGEAMRLVYYSPTTTIESPIRINSWVDKSKPNGVDASLVFYHMSSLYPSGLEFDQTTMLTNLENKVSLSVYPNPAVDKVTIELELDRSSNVVVELLNTSGQKLIWTDSGMVDAGNSMIELNVSALSAGVYLLNIHVGERVETRKLLIVK